MPLSLESQAEPESESQLQLDGVVEVMDIKWGGGKYNHLKSIPHPLASCHMHTPFLCQCSSCSAEEDSLSCGCLNKKATFSFTFLQKYCFNYHPECCCQTRQTESGKNWNQAPFSTWLSSNLTRFSLRSPTKPQPKKSRLIQSWKHSRPGGI